MDSHRFITLRRTLLTLSAALLASACSAVGYHDLPARSGPPAPTVDAVSSAGIPSEARTLALLVVVDGLRRDSLAAYLKALEDDDLEPTWPSGLARLGRDGFRLATSARAQAPLPATHLSGAATLATGQYPGVTGVPGPVFYRREGPGHLTRTDLKHPLHAARLFYAPALKLPVSAESAPEAPRSDAPLSTTVVQAPTLFERLAPTHSTTAIFYPFGAGGRWLIPDRPAVGLRAMLRDRAAVPVVPIFDRGVRNAAIDRVVAEELPDLVTLYFTSLALETCFQDDEACEGHAGDIEHVQRNGLMAVDGHLDRIIDKLARAHPDRYDRLVILMVGTTGLVDRTEEGEPITEHEMPASDLGEALAAFAERPRCATWLTTARAQGLMSVAPSDGAAQIYLAEGPRGAAPSEGQSCLDEALTNAVAKAPWLSAAAWLNPEVVEDPPVDGRARSARYQVRVKPAARKRIAASRRSGLEGKIRRAVDDRAQPTTGAALLFAEQPWRFVDEATRARRLYAYQGTLEDEAVQVGFLVASRALSGPVATELKYASVELADVAPTLITLLEAPETALEGLPRPPVLRWIGPRNKRTLELVRADRQLASEPAAGDGVLWSVGEDKVYFGLEESSDLRAPDVVDLSVGQTTWRWTYDDQFPKDSPCTSTEAGDLRRWVCHMPRPEAPGGAVLGLRRDPHPDPDAEGVRQRLFPILWPEATAEPPELAPWRVTCGDEEGVRLSGLEPVTDPLKAVARVELSLEGPFLTEASTSFAELSESLEVARLEPNQACTASGPAAEGCQLEVQASTEALVFKRLPRMLAHLLALDSYLPRPTDPPPGLKGLNGQRPRPSAVGWLTLRVCRFDGRCSAAPLMSDRDLRALLAQGCEAAQ